VLVLPLEQGHRELVVDDVRYVDRVDPEVVSTLGQAIERLVLRHPQHRLHAEHDERGAAACRLIGRDLAQGVGEILA
jgi:hypothetical protein